MAIDPNNPNIVYVGTPQNGLFVTTNGGATWQSVSAVPVSRRIHGDYPGITGILFDPASAASPAAKPTPSLLQVTETASMKAPMAARHGQRSVARASRYTLPFPAPASTMRRHRRHDLWSYANGAWTQLLTSVERACSVAINPTNPNEIVAHAAALNISYDGGETWSGIITAISYSTDIPWLRHYRPHVDQRLAFNPLVPNELIVSAGTGVWNTMLPTSGLCKRPRPSFGMIRASALSSWSPTRSSCHPAAIRFSPPGTAHSSTSAIPTPIPRPTGPLRVANRRRLVSIDYASSNPSFVVGLADWYGAEGSGYSTNGGQTWTPFASFTPGAGTST